MRSKNRGFSLVELMAALTVFGLIISLSFAYMSQSQRLYQRVNASGSADVGLRRAAVSLERDLENAAHGSVKFTNNGTGPQRCGDAVWLLSAEDPTSGEFARHPDGSLFWQKNILYYLTVPQDHDERYQMTCNEFDQVCSHKILVKLVIDNGVSTTPSSPRSSEELLLSPADASGFLIRPSTIDLSPLATDPRVISATLVASHLLDNRVSSAREEREIRCQLTAGLIEDARKNFALGKVPFPEKSFTLSRTVAVILPN